jgi:serine/threonine protein kinase
MEQSVIGKIVDNYQITAVLGKGGMGVVYRARNRALEKDVALKMMDTSLARDESFLKRFQSEAKALAKLQNPNIVTVYDLRETELGFCIIMEFVEGTTLAVKIKQWGPLPVKMAVSVFKQMLTALDHAHKVGVIHRDIKPSNIMLTEQNVVKVTDFGLAKIQQVSAATVTMGTGGTLYYMSPEQIRGLSNVDERGDIYSLGMTLYEAVAGQVPFGDADADFAIRQAIVEGKILPPSKFNPAIPKELVRIVMKSIDKDPARRFQTAAEMREALEKFERESLPEQKTPGAEGTRIVDMPSPGRSKRPLILAAGIVLVFLIGFVLYRQFAPSPVARLSLSSSPAGATVVIDGTPVGTSPLADYSLSPGITPVSLVLTGFKTKDTTITAAAGENLSLALSLEKIPAEPPPPVTRNTESVEREPVPSVKGSTSPVVPATLIVQVFPSGSVMVDGVAKADDARRRTEVQVQAGKRIVTFNHPRYGSKSFTVDLRSGGRRELMCYFETFVSIIAQPVWAKIVIDGKNTDLDTPLDRYPLGPGKHRITVTRTGYRTVEGMREIVVEPGTEEKVIPLVFTLQKQ